ncbi:MAG: ATP-binding protein [Lachnospiraceae bacterium]|nr:ATP-binding protein [Lachnospiraceae bacterium]
MAYIQRHLQESILQLSGEYPVILVAGPRGAGKTTVLRMLMDMEEALPSGYMARAARVPGLSATSSDHRRFVSLDDLAKRDMAKNDPSLFLQIFKPPLLISEIQYAPELLPFIKKRIEEDRRPGDFWLTGSHLYDLMDSVYKELAGDVALLNLFSLSHSEMEGIERDPFRADRGYLSSIHESSADAARVFDAIWSGSAPGRRENAPGTADKTGDDQAIWEAFYSHYIDSCIRRDVRDIGGAIDPLKFLHFMTAAAARCGEVLNVKAIADDARIDQVTARGWLGILANIGIIFYLHPYEHDALKRALKAPRLYFYDTGLVCYLTRWTSPSSAMTGAMRERLFECYIVSEIVKGYCHHGTMPYIYYYRDRDGAEISLIMKEDGVLHPVRICMSGDPVKRMTSSFVLLERTGEAIGDGAVICLTDRLRQLGDGIYAVPANYI